MPALRRPCSDPSRRHPPWPWLWPHASRSPPLRPQPRASPRAAARRWPSARRLRAGLLHPTDWRCPAGRLKGAPTSRRPAPPRPARGRARPAPPARPASGGLGGGPRPPPPPPVRRPRAGSSGEQTPPPARPNCARPLLALASGTCRARAAPRPKFVQGRPPRGVCENGGGPEACGPAGVASRLRPCRAAPRRAACLRVAEPAPPAARESRARRAAGWNGCGRSEVGGRRDPAAGQGAPVPEPAPAEPAALRRLVEPRVPGGPRRAHRDGGLDTTCDFCIWCEVLGNEGGGGVTDESNTALKYLIYHFGSGMTSE